MMDRQLLASDFSPEQPRACRIVEYWIQTERLPHAVLLCGPPGIGKRNFSVQLASALLCQNEFTVPCSVCSSCRKVNSFSHRDLKFLLPSIVGKSNRSTESREGFNHLQEYFNEKSCDHSGISIKQVRELQDEMAYTSYENGRKVAILFESELMHHAAANSLLKILEEPSQNSIFIVVTSYPDRLLSTILSRCHRLTLKPLNKNDMRHRFHGLKFDEELLELGIRLGQGSISMTREIMDGGLNEIRKIVERFIKSGLLHRDEMFWGTVDQIGKEKSRDQQVKFLEVCAYYLRDLFLIKNQQSDLIVMVDRKKYLNSLINYWDEDQIEIGIRSLDQAKESIQRNVGFDLVLIDFWRFLRHLGATK